MMRGFETFSKPLIYERSTRTVHLPFVIRRLLTGTSHALGASLIYKYTNLIAHAHPSDPTIGTHHPTNYLPPQQPI